jgi:site-specific DNA-methyltransferase (adenine-specific)
LIPTRFTEPPLDQIIQADSLSLLSALPEGCCDLIYVDPPFCTGRPRRSTRHPSQYDDQWAGGIETYLAFLRARIVEMRRVLRPTGTLYVHLDWRTVHRVRVELETIFGHDHFLNEIIWSYRTGGVSRRWFGRKHDNILVYVKDRGRHTFNVLREGAFRTDGLKYDDDGRPYKSTKRGKLYFNTGGPVMTDVWEIPFLSTGARERTGYPSQKPEALLRRIVSASSNPGDVVADFFCGSGTTAAAAKVLGRRWLCCDSSADAVEIARRRLDEHPYEVSRRSGRPRKTPNQ